MLTRLRFVGSVGLVLVVVTLCFSARAVAQDRSSPRSSSAGQKRPAERPSWKVAKTADGQPDISGMWVAGVWLQPLETPAPRAVRESAGPGSSDSASVGAVIH